MGTNKINNLGIGAVKETIQLGGNLYSEGVIANGTGSDIVLPVGAILARTATGTLVVFNHAAKDVTGIPVGFNIEGRTIPAGGNATIKIVTGGLIDAAVVKFTSPATWATIVELESAATDNVWKKSIQTLVEDQGFEIHFGKVKA